MDRLQSAGRDVLDRIRQLDLESISKVLYSRFIILIPLSTTFLGFLLITISLFAGIQTGKLEDLAIIRFNTTGLGHNVVNTVFDAISFNTTGLGDEIVNAMSGQQNSTNKPSPRSTLWERSVGFSGASSDDAQFPRDAVLAANGLAVVRSISAQFQPRQLQPGQAPPEQAPVGQAQPGQVQAGQEQPEQAQPEQAQPAQAQPEQAQAQPGQAQPGQPQPEQAQPGQAQPEQAQPEQAQPEQAQAPPEQAQPAQGQPEQAQPEQAQAQPGQAQPGQPQPEQAQPGQTQPEQAQPEQAQPEQAQAQPEQAQPEQAQPGQAQPGQAQPEQAQPGQAQPEQAQPEQAQPEQAQPEQAQPAQAQPTQAQPAQAQPQQAQPQQEQAQAQPEQAQPGQAQSAAGGVGNADSPSTSTDAVPSSTQPTQCAAPSASSSGLAGGISGFLSAATGGGLGGSTITKGINKALQTAFDGAKEAVKKNLAGVGDSAADQITERFRVSEWYSLHVIDLCQGSFKGPNDAGVITTSCNTKPADRLDSIKSLTKPFVIGPVTIDLSNTNLPQTINQTVDSINGFLFVLFLIYLFSMLLSLLAMAVTVGSFLFPLNKWVMIVNLTATAGAALLSGVSTVVITIVGSVLVSATNKLGVNFGVSASRGGGFLALTWFGTVMLFISMAFWIGLLTFLFVDVKLQKSRQRQEEKIAEPEFMID